ncbi:hypothetical protein CYMTET_4339 [Cymbomonas tetramitiformis]|uniref:Uncharacterized protein n=1 Tax=Cymbomonas tetramitiformis TaxID=36881 RepID=A0AAE0H1K5_9CHLO|nr:hypothetical protein CYMTET_4339 [Cymbomonas tetramitiformis]
MPLAADYDMLHPPAELEKRKHKLKRLVQSPNSFFMDVKCQGCFNITTVPLVAVPASPKVALSAAREIKQLVWLASHKAPVAVG